MKNQEGKTFHEERNDQLQMILSTIGKPSEEEMSFLTDEKAKDYLRSMENFERRNFNELFPEVDKNIINILDNILRFDPNKRLSVDEALKMKYFD